MYCELKFLETLINLREEQISFNLTNILYFEGSYKIKTHATFYC